MTNDEEVEAVDTILTLPTGTSAAAIANACRDAALEFINDSTRWGKAELATWLAASYAPIAKHTSKDGPDGGWPVPLLRDIDARLIERIVTSARTEILDMLRHIATDGSASFVLRALISGSVIRCEDALGEPAWAPTNEATRLADRVLSLFAVDYLAQPGDYESALSVCAKCEAVSFDESVRRRGQCHHHGTHSLLSRRRNTLPFPPLGA
jgi:hypothetical protein